MKRVLIACIILLILGAGSISSYSTIRQITETSIRAVSEAEHATEQTDAAAALSCLQNGHKHWCDASPLLSTLIDHRTIDEIDTLYYRSISFAQSSDLAHLLAELTELSSALERMQKTEHLSIENIL